MLQRDCVLLSTCLSAEWAGFLFQNYFGSLFFFLIRREDQIFFWQRRFCEQDLMWSGTVMNCSFPRQRKNSCVTACMSCNRMHVFTSFFLIKIWRLIHLFWLQIELVTWHRYLFAPCFTEANFQISISYHRIAQTSSNIVAE